MKQLSKLVWSTATAFALVVAMGSPAAAQGKTEVAAGYHFANASAGGASTSYPAGWFADVAFPLSGQPLSIVGSIDGSYKSETIPGFGDVSTKFHTFGGGVRYNLPASGKMTPFAQFLIGAASTSASSGGTSNSTTDGAIDISGGTNWGLNDKWTLRLGVGYRRVMATTGVNVFLFNLGVVLPIGK